MAEGYERMIYAIKQTGRFKRQYKLMEKRGEDMSLLNDIVKKLSLGQPLPPKNNDHPLKGVWAGSRECHVGPDWLLVYRADRNALTLELLRTGSHADLF